MSERDETTILVPDFGPLEIETDCGVDGYVMRVTQQLSGRARQYQIDVVIRALEAAGYEVSKRP